MLQGHWTSDGRASQQAGRERESQKGGKKVGVVRGGRGTRKKIGKKNGKNRNVLPTEHPQKRNIMLSSDVGIIGTPIEHTLQMLPPTQYTIKLIASCAIHVVAQFTSAGWAGVDHWKTVSLIDVQAQQTNGHRSFD